VTFDRSQTPQRPNGTTPLAERVTTYA
jgi:hypothetical protein